MNTAKETARIATQVGQLADSVKPPEGDPYTHSRNLAIFHLRAAASLLRQIAEARAAKEPAQ